jgi:hypothetical protein
MLNPGPIQKDYVYGKMHTQRDESIVEMKRIRPAPKEANEEEKEAFEGTKLTKLASEQNSSAESSFNPFIMNHGNSNFGSKTM